VVSGDLNSALQAAMEYDSSERRIASLKTTVSNFFRASDPTARIRHTEYFNHSFAPDLVVSWPQENRERLVFLRTNSDPRWLAEDLKVIAPSHPILLTLGSTTAVHDDSATSQLVAAAKEARALITDPDAIEEISAPTAPIASVLANAVMRGGLGIVDGESARSATRSAVAGFSGASNLEPEPIRAALSNAEHLLDDEQASRFTRLYQAVWEGQGGAVEDFPSHRFSWGQLTSSDLSLLLATLSTDDPQFWRRIGRNLRLEQITGAGLLRDSQSLDRLVEANLDRLLARGARVFGRSGSSHEEEEVRWNVGKRCLVLRGSSWSVYFAAKVADLPPYERRNGVPMATLMAGVQELGVRLTDVKVQQLDFAISIESVGSADVVDSPDFSELVARGESVARSAAIAVPSGRSLIAEFTTGTATGHTNAAFALNELGPPAIKLLLDLSESESAEVSTRLVAITDPEVIQPTLWD